MVVSSDSACRCSDFIVVIQTQVGNLFLAYKIPQGVFQFLELNEEILFEIEIGCALRALEVK